MGRADFDVVSLTRHAVLNNAGVRGCVTAARSGRPLAATLMVDGIAWNTSAEPVFGFYARPLTPGRYTLRALVDGYAPGSTDVVVPADGSGAVVDFSLQPLRGANPGQLSGGGGLAADNHDEQRLQRQSASMAVIGAFICMFGAVALLHVCQSSRGMLAARLGLPGGMRGGGGGGGQYQLAATGVGIGSRGGAALV